MARRQGHEPGQVGLTVVVGLASAATCRIVTRGRRSGREHVTTVWFALDGTTLYAPVRHGDHSDWLRNALAAPDVAVRTGRLEIPATARRVTDPDEVRAAVELLAEKYARHGDVVGAWRERAPVVARVDLTEKLGQ